jgi:murein DD-endopeptidase MepM/ murein hydrolase activator NlpD
VRDSVNINRESGTSGHPADRYPGIPVFKSLGCLGFSLLNLGNMVANTPAQAAISVPLEEVNAVVAPVVDPGLAPTPPAIAVPERFSPESSVLPISLPPAPPVDASLTPALVNPVAVPATAAEALSAPPADEGGYEAPATVIFSERSSGCEMSLGQGQDLTQGICGGQLTVPTPPTATNATGFAPAAPESYAPVPSGPFGLGSSGLGFNLPSVKPYFNQGPRPLGRPGNGNISLLFPLSIPASITSLFGWRTHPISGTSRFHSGTDIGAPMGTPVLAALAGQVTLADFMGGYGLAIALDHSKGTQQTLYAHLSEIFVKPGEWIKQGTVIGRVGSTGASTGPHLHFEFRQLTADGWVAQDPGFALEQALAQLLQSMQVAQVPGETGDLTTADPTLPQPLMANKEAVISTSAVTAQTQRLQALAQELMLAAQANQPLKETTYDSQKLPIGRIASTPVVE